MLATINTSDFIYSCESHLSDKGFATKVEAGVGSKSNVSQDEIDRVKRDWEEKQAAKRENEKNKVAKDKEKDKEKDKDKKEDKASVTQEPTKTPPPSTPEPATPTHAKYVLHRDIFAMRLAEHRRARQAKAAKELAPRLPGAPLGGV